MDIRRVFLTILSFLIVNITQASQLHLKLLEEKKLPHNLGNYKNFSLINDESIQIYTVILNSNYQARIMQQKESSIILAKSIESVATEHKSYIAINGGFYTAEFKPAGLYKEENNTIGKLSSRTILTSCVKVNKHNHLIIEKDAKLCEGAGTPNAIQIGPILIQNGERSSKLNSLRKMKLKSNFLAKHRRTIIAESEIGRIILIVTTPVTLDHITEILMNNAHAFGINQVKNAVNLDGGSSTGLYIAFSDKPFYISELKNVKTIILIRD